MTTLYKKVGRRYCPVAEHEEWDSYPEGAHLVICQPGSTLRRFNVEPDHAGFLAAAEPLRKKIIDLVQEKLHARPSRPPATQKQIKAWNAFKAAMGNDAYCVEYASLSEISEAVVDLVAKEASHANTTAASTNGDIK